MLPPMRLTVRADQPLNLAATKLEALAQQLATLLGTPAGSVPLDRAFGLDWSLVDSPAAALMPLYVSEVAVKVERYIPQLRLVSAYRAQGSEHPSDTTQGRAIPVAVVEIREEYLDEYR